MKNTGDRINHKLDITENKNSEFEDTTIETNPNETQTEKIIEKKKWEKYILFKGLNIWKIRTMKGKEQKVFEEIMAKIF